MKLKVKKLHPDAIIPKYAHHDDAGVDLFCVEAFELKPGERKSIPTGISMEIPEGFVGLIWDKGGLSQRHGMKSFGGVVDAGFRGDINVGLMNLSDKSFVFEKGHKIAQLLIQRIENVSFEEVNELSPSSRGENKFGSTGK
jgi:dUTP pyrophosphatase